MAPLLFTLAEIESVLPIVRAAVPPTPQYAWPQLAARTGADVFLALALGADAVLIGRLAAYGLAAAGEAGVRRTIELLAEELRTLMILAGIASVDQIPPGTVTEREVMGRTVTQK